MSAVGYIHHFESLGAVDGPGLRFVVFMQGCPLQCLYCHNPDSRCMKEGRVFSVDQVLSEIEPFETWFKESGGITLSGGEALMQPEFVSELFARAHERGWHTALDTSGALLGPLQKEVLEHTDLILLDIKSMDPLIHRDLTGWDLKHILDFAVYLSKLGRPMWIRHVLIPGITLIREDLEKLSRFVQQLGSVQKVEFLPYHKMGEEKWAKIGQSPPLEDYRATSQEEVDWARRVFADAGYQGEM